MSKPVTIKLGDKHNLLTFLEESDIKFNKNWKKIRYGMFECECGNTKEIIISNVMSNHTKSCGCQYTRRWKKI
jgi:hypothetical protein